jgi:hypothetical protein
MGALSSGPSPIPSPGPGPARSPGAIGGSEAEAFEPPDLSVLERTLTGQLACARCRYALTGLSVRDVCPECGLAVRATLLAVVDPRAKELQPIRWPGLVAMGLLVWAIAPVLAAVLVWVLRARDIAGAMGLDLQTLPSGWLGAWVTGLVLASGVGALTIVRPHARLGARAVAGAAIAAAMYLPLAWCLHRVLVVIDHGHPGPYDALSAAEPARMALRLAAGVFMLLIVLGLRENVRALEARSIMLREGRVERQTSVALLAALGVTSLGDGMMLSAVMGWTGAFDQTLWLVGKAVVAVGSMFLTLGLIGTVQDVWRARAAVLAPPLTLNDVLEPRDSEPA